MLTNAAEFLTANPDMINPEGIKLIAGVFLGGLAALALGVGSSIAGPTALLASSMAEA
ncbi:MULTISPECIES: hypothetical protein [Corynebacterium]|uniref:Uncharacterized protein n=1 Tax=Corynebacterium singulare TaxID=161899 RepID=A0ABS9PWV6_9CORY|nr:MULTISPECIES: hypothetical protein [Corynebacterium]MCG7276708.1 hypothetical protein [Corynebacterium singulare]MCQ9676625.1 hypothetical protein [Corynebacterium sp. BF-R-2]